MTSNSANGAGNSVGAGSPIVIHGQYVKDLSFENPNAPQILAPGQPNPEITVKMDVEIKTLAESSYEVTLKTRAEAKHGETVGFIVELAYAGVFSLQNIPADKHRSVLTVEGPRYLFPFARTILADATRNGGFPPLMLNPIDFGTAFRRANQSQQDFETVAQA